MAEKILTVTQLTRIIRNAIEAALPYPIAVTGEISNWTVSSRGHTYFSLKDEESLIKCALWQSVKTSRNFKDGDKVKVTGRISLYEPQGTYQISVSSMEMSGLGELYQRFLKIKEKLEKEGVFDEERKLPIPPYPLKIGIITSPTGSVIQDISNILLRRAPYIKKYLYPASVQGEESAGQIIKGIEYFNSQKPDIIIIARGGGSMEDLWPFNSEELAYAIFNSKVPVISAVGHETDFTIADFAASLRAPTPSAAAEIASKDVRDTLSFLDDSRRAMAKLVTDKGRETRRSFFSLKQGFYISALSPIGRKRDAVSFMEEEMHNAVKAKIDFCKSSLSGLLLEAEKNNPSRLLERRISAVNSCRAFLLGSLPSATMKAKAALSSFSHSLDALSPVNVLERGYAIVTKSGGEALSSVSGIESGDEVGVRMKDGRFVSKVISKKEER